MGSGPSGMAAAIVLARAGQNVTVYERHNDVGGRYHGDFQGLENWSYKTDALDEFAAMGIQLASCSRPYRGATVYNPRFKPLVVESEKPLYYLVSRGQGDGSLDMALKAQALEAGVKLKFNTAISIEDADIIASGPRGVTAIVGGMTFETDDADGAYVIFNDELAPGGYAYLLISNNKATVAIVLSENYPDVQSYLDRTLEKCIEVANLSAPKKPRRWGGYGAFGIPSTGSDEKGRLYVGEAAGFQDMLFGFGIRYGLASGCLAATSILEGSNYDRLWQAHFQPRLKASMSNRYLFNRLGSVAYNLLWLATGKSSNPDKVLYWLYNWTLLKKLAFPLAKRSFSQTQTGQITPTLVGMAHE